MTAQNLGCIDRDVQQSKTQKTIVQKREYKPEIEQLSEILGKDGHMQMQKQKGSILRRNRPPQANSQKSA